MSYDVESYDYAWLRLKKEDIKDLKSPLSDLSDWAKDNFHLHILKIMRNPRYMHWTVKNLLNVDLLPEQVVILQELWSKSFPMYIASRGFGKALEPNTPVRTKDGWTPIKDLEVGDKVYGSDGKLTNVIMTTQEQTNLNYYRITLRDGRQIDCCEDHMWKVWDKNKNKNKASLVWSEISTKEMVDNYYWNRKGNKSSGKEYRYALPINKPIEDSEKEYKLHPYVLGVLLGDGCMTQRTITISSNDFEIIENVKSLLPYGYTIDKMPSSDKDYIITRSNNKVPAFYKLLEEIGIFGHNSKTKFIPEEYKYGSIDQRMDLVRGLMDTDGYSNGQSVIEYYTISDKLSNGFLDIARSLGLHCKQSIREAWYRGERYNDCYRISIYTDQEVFTLPRKLDYLKHTVSKQGQSKYEKVFITNIEYIGKKDGYCIQVDNEDKTYITKDYIVTHNSFLLAVYSTLRCLLIPGSKIVIVGAAFRQSKVIFEYMETIWRNAPILRSLCSDNSGPRRDIDRCTLRINDSWTIAVPLGDGGKIRGLRAHTIIADEFNCLEGNTLVETDSGLIRIGSNEDPSNLMINTGDDSLPYEKPDTYVTTQAVDAYEVKFENGYVIRCSENHQLMTKDEDWKLAVDLKAGDYVESTNKYKFPSSGPIGDEKLCWLMGILVSEGSICNESRLSMKTTDLDLANKISKEFGFKIHTRDAYVDRRGWNCKKSYELYIYDKSFRKQLYDFGLDYVKANNKKIPSGVLKESKSCMLAFLEGLFEGDGSCFTFSSGKIDNRLGLAYYSVSEQLCRDVQIVLDKLGFDSYINKRKSKISKNDQWFIRLNGIDAYTLSSIFNIDRFNIALSNCYVPKEPCYYTWDKGRKQWKISIKYCDKVIQKRFKDLSMAQGAIDEIISRPRYRKVKSVRKLKNKMILYDYHLPITHSFYAGGFRNHNSIPVEIYETVVAGFAAVSKDPVNNVKSAARRKAMQDDGVWSDSQEEKYQTKHKNQSILSGTAGYDFEPYAAYWKKYKSIIKHKGDFKKIAEEEGANEDDTPDYLKSLNADSFSIVRIPYELIPPAFMSDEMVSRSRATMHTGTYLMEYGASFAKDSQGFFKRTMIEACVASDKNLAKDNWAPWCPSVFDVETRGHQDKKYVFGIDPASEVDNLALIILEIHPEHQRIVYSWTTNRKDFQDRKRLGLTEVGDYYSFVVRKIRDLMQVFPCIRIGIDSQGGGYQIAEGLRDPDKMRAELNEQALLPIIDDSKAKETDRLPGLHIVELVNFASAEWTSQANHGLRKDMEDRILLFPRFDNLTLGMITAQDEMRFKQLKKQVGDTAALKLYDTLEDVIMDIEDLKAELSTIMVTRSASGREKFDTPEIKLDTGKKGRMRKDRYSALVIANMIARTMHREIPNPAYSIIGRSAASFDQKKEKDGKMYIGQHWASSYDVRSVAIVRRGQ